MTQEQTIQHIIQYPVVPVFFNSDPDTCKNVFEACYKGGVRAFEFTNRGSNALSTFQQLAASLPAYPGYILGAGTIFTQADAEAFIEAGATFIVSPCYSEAVFDVCYQHKIPYMPGCMTVKEVFDAGQAGCEVVKIFPGEVVGPKFVKSVKSILPKQKMMVTGGVEPTKESMDTWFSAGVTAVGMGSQFFKKEWLDNKNYTAITDVCKICFNLLK